MFFIFIVDILARKFFWYYSIWYFDMVMHFFGGLWAGLFFVWFLSIKDLSFPEWSLGLLSLSDYKIVYKTLLFVLIVGVLWEIFEIYANNYLGGDSFNILDTVSDVFFDLAGGATAVFYLLNRIMLQSKDGH